MVDGTTTVTSSYEGLEAADILIEGGTIDVTASDDGVNAAGGSSTDAAGAGGGPNMAAAGDYSVVVSGGDTTISSEGDGLDSNGTARVTGGVLVVNGPTNDGNGALDVDGDLTVEGGTVVAAGSAGMAVTPSTDSAQSSLQLTSDTALPAGTVVQVADSSGELIGTFVTEKEAASIVFSSEGMEDGEEYTVYTGGTAGTGAGLVDGTLKGATEVSTLTAGEYTAGGMGFGGGRP